MRTRLKKWRLLAVAGGLTVLLAGCSSGGSAAGGSPEAGANSVDQALEAGGTITYWTWTGSAKAQVAAFEKAYPKVKVNLVNAGTGTTEYTKLQNVIKAGSGAPDVAQIEYFALPQFEITGGVADLAPYGFASLKSKYSAATWGEVTSGNKIYGLPQDSGPMALFYNKSVFDKFKLTVPKTWDEYVADAKKLHSADSERYITSDNGDPGFTTSMIWQAGGKPFTTSGKKISINLQDAGAKKWTGTWNTLVENQLVSPTSGFTNAWYKQLGNGQIATLIVGAWAPGVLEQSVPQGKGQWRVAPMPTYGGAAATAENGGSSQAVIQQSSKKVLAAGFLKWLNSSPESLKIFVQQGGFPSTTANLNAQSFVNEKPAYFGKQAIYTVLSAASEQVLPGFSYLPYQVYANSIYPDTVGQSYQKHSDLNAGLMSWQQALVEYGNQQGFSVTGQ